MDAELERGRPNNLPLIMLALLLIMVALMIGRSFAVAAREVTNPNDDHPVARHFADAVLIEQACGKPNGVYAVYRERASKDVYHQLCRLEDGRWGVWIVRLVRDHYETVTRFVPKDGSYKKVLEYILSKATLYNGFH